MSKCRSLELSSQWFAKNGILTLNMRLGGGKRRGNRMINDLSLAFRLVYSILRLVGVKGFC